MRLLQLCFALAFTAISVSNAHAYQKIIPGPPGSESFGNTVTYLPNGNLVVIDAGFDLDGVQNVGAVFIYRQDGMLLSRLTGAFANDRLGSSDATRTGGKVWLLAGSNFLVRSFWNGDRGAVTFVNGDVGLNGVISASNSLVGSSPGDRVGTATSDTGLVLLRGGDYVVHTANWDAPSVVNAGAVTVGSGSTGISGVVSASNSLVGSRVDDFVGDSVVPISANSFVVRSSRWDRPTGDGQTFLINSGAWTWMQSSSPIIGPVSESNSLTTDNELGVSTSLVSSITPLTQGGFVIGIPSWDNRVSNQANVGAVVRASGALSGSVSAANALTGQVANDEVGSNVLALADGNYLVLSDSLDQNRGAVRWMSGSVSATGTHSAANSLVGSLVGDSVGFGGATALPNGGYVVMSPLWDRNGQQNVGAVTFGAPGVGVAGPITNSNSLVGVLPGDLGGEAVRRIAVLTNGNYVISAPNWSNGELASAGAAIFGSGSAGVSGEISASNALIGGAAGDLVSDTALEAGKPGVIALSNGHYVVGSRSWDNGAVTNVGAATWGNGVLGTVGIVSTANSFIGLRSGHGVGGARALNNGHYVVRSDNRESGLGALGAVTWRDGSGANPGVLDISNSLMGSRFNDNVGSRIIALTNGNYVISSVDWANGTMTRAGAITWGNGLGPSAGLLSASNSLVGGRVDDRIGRVDLANIGQGVLPLQDGNYFFPSQYFVVLPPQSSLGAVSLGSGKGGQFGLLSTANTAFGGRDASNFTANADYSLQAQTLAVGQPSQNRVVLQELGIFQDGFE